MTADVDYVNERFEETDILPPLSMAIAAQSFEGSLNAIFRAHSPRDSALPPDVSFDQSISRSLAALIFRHTS